MYDNALAQIETLGHMKEKLETKIAEQDDEIDRLTRINRKSIVPRGSILVINDQLSLKDNEIKDLRRKMEAFESILSQIASLTNEGPVQALIAEVQGSESSAYTEFRHLFLQEKEKNSHLNEELHITKQRLEEALKDKSRSVDEMMETIRAESAAALKEQLAAQQSMHETAISELSEEKSRLLQEIEYEQINYRNLESTKAEEERLLKKKVNSLERNLEQLTLMYQKAANQTSILKLDHQSFEKKLHSKEHKIDQLRKELIQIKEVNPSPPEQVNEAERVQRFLMNRTGFGSTKIKKTIKGGKAQKLRVMGMFSPLASLGSVNEAKRNDKPGDDSEETRD